MLHPVATFYGVTLIIKKVLGINGSKKTKKSLQKS
jgi:hypothetical protein